MKRSIKYLVVLCVVLVCVYGFWAWLQYKWATVIKQTTAAIMTQLQTVEKLETISKTLTKTIEGEQELATLTPSIGVDQILGSALFKDKVVLDVQGIITAWYLMNNVTTWDITVSRDGTVTIVLWAPEIFGITLTGTTKTSQLGIVTSGDIALENILRTKAGELMIQEALSGGILEEAKANAQSKLQELFLKSTIQIKEVIIKGTGDVDTTEAVLE